MTLATLYKRTKTGAIQYWHISTVENVIFKESGQLGTTSPIKHSEQVAGKNIGRANATTPFIQAINQAQSDWTRKHDEGYKTLADLKIKSGTEEDGSTIYYQEATVDSPFSDWTSGTWADENGNIILHTLEAVLDRVLPKFNTDANGNVKPMLATDWKKIKKIDYPVHVQPKYDGVRCLMVITPATGNVIFLSRKGKEYTTLQHIKECFSLSVLHKLQEDVVLDGEIYSDELNFQEIVSAVKAYKPSSLKLKFRAYDIITNEAWHTRIHRLSRLVQDIDSKSILVTPTKEAHNEAAVKELHDDYVKSGHEGAMIRLLSGRYGQGQRSRELLKVKEFDETEFTVQCLEYGQRGIEDLLAVCSTETGKEFRAKIEGSLAQKAAFERDYQEAYETEKSSKLTVKHFGWTEDFKPRFPIGKTLRNYE